ncbi:hypothetical protein EDC01DRAFT_636938 [Geopyxis carbonaria]|nr:hypothetical protein EDC01DRAFT_636938 [Geopyxis carbonaria]
MGNLLSSLYESHDFEHHDFDLEDWRNDVFIYFIITVIAAAMINEIKHIEKIFKVFDHKNRNPTPDVKLQDRKPLGDPLYFFPESRKESTDITMQRTRSIKSSDMKSQEKDSSHKVSFYESMYTASARNRAYSRSRNTSYVQQTGSAFS